MKQYPCHQKVLYDHVISLQPSFTMLICVSSRVVSLHLNLAVAEKINYCLKGSSQEKYNIQLVVKNSIRVQHAVMETSAEEVHLSSIIICRCAIYLSQI